MGTTSARPSGIGLRRPSSKVPSGRDVSPSRLRPPGALGASVAAVARSKRASAGAVVRSSSNSSYGVPLIARPRPSVGAVVANNRSRSGFSLAFLLRPCEVIQTTRSPSRVEASRSVSGAPFFLIGRSRPADTSSVATGAPPVRTSNTRSTLSSSLATTMR